MTNMLALEVTGASLILPLAFAALATPNRVKEQNMAKANQKNGANSAAILRSVIEAAWNEAGSQAATRAAIAAASGLDPKEVRGAYIIGHVARSGFGTLPMDAAIEKAKALIALPGASGKASNRRTQAQETIYGNARRSWGRYAAKKQIDTGEKRGGNQRKPRPPVKGTDKRKAGDPAPKAAPKFKTPANGYEWVKSYAALIQATVKKNGLAPLSPLVDALLKECDAHLAN